MPAQLNHTIVPARDKRESATYLTDILGLPPPAAFGPFMIVQCDNGVSLDFADCEGPVKKGHYAFLVSELEFDEIFTRIQRRRQTYWADPMKGQANRINHHDGGRGVYWEDPNGHMLEIITRPYGSGT
jgi:catechol 2,3-dioxygenase-like lactoylglutathione lyase family enzyme